MPFFQSKNVSLSIAYDNFEEADTFKTLISRAIDDDYFVKTTNSDNQIAYHFVKQFDCEVTIEEHESLYVVKIKKNGSKKNKWDF